jgi:DNA polymerase (family 10)
MTHGLDPTRLARQIHEIDRLNEKLKNFTILRGIEVDILRDGNLDLPDSSLAKLDIVVAAVHSHFDLPRQAQTERVVRALENRHVSILAHPTGRDWRARPMNRHGSRDLGRAQSRMLPRDQRGAGPSGFE